MSAHLSPEDRAELQRLRAAIEALIDEWSDSAAYGDCPDGFCGSCTRGQDAEELRLLLHP